MAKRKLKGMNAKRIPKHKKEKMEKTLEIMGKNREEDNRNLRDFITAKLEWAIAEKQKGVKVIERTRETILRLEGIILAYKEVLNPPKKEDKEK